MAIRIMLSKVERDFDIVVKGKNKQGDRGQRHAEKVELADVSGTLGELVAELEAELGPV